MRIFKNMHAYNYESVTKPIWRQFAITLTTEYELKTCLQTKSARSFLISEM